MKSASDVLQSLLQNSKSPLAEQFVRWRLWRYWNEIIGPEWGHVSKPVEFKNGRLILWVASSSHLNEMTYLLEPMKMKINKYLARTYVHHIRLTRDQRALRNIEPLDVECDLERLDK